MPFHNRLLLSLKVDGGSNPRINSSLKAHLEFMTGGNGEEGCEGLRTDIPSHVMMI